MSDRAFLPISGRYQPPRSSGSFPVIMTRDGDELVITRDGETEPLITGLGLNDVKVDAKLGSIDRKIYLPEGALFETPYSDSVDLMFGRSFWNDVSAWERFSPRLVVVVIACFIAIFGVWKYALPIGADIAARVTPQAYVTAADAGTLATLDRLFLNDTQIAEDRRNAIEVEFNRLLEALPPAERNHNYRLLFRNSEVIGPNAFAMPAGTIVVTDQLVEIFDDNGAVVAVLGHEIGHVAERHSLREIYQAAGLAIFIGLVIGDVGPILEEVIVEANLLRSLSRSRAAEASADRFAVQLLQRAGRDPSGLIRFFEVLEDEMGDNYGEEGEDQNATAQEIGNWYSTHPITRQRIEAIRKEIAQQ